MEKRERRVGTVPVLCAAVASLLLAAGCSGAPADQSGDSALVVSAVKIDESAVGWLATGKVMPEEEIQVTAKLPGKATAVRVKEGMTVKAGQVLAELEADDAAEQVRQAEAGLRGAEARLADAKAGTRAEEVARLQSGVEQAKAALDNAQKQYDRLKAMYDAGALSQADLDRAVLDLEKARTSYDQAKAQLEQAKAGPTANSLAALQAEVDRLRAGLAMAKNALDSTRITSPIDGIVARVNIDPGELAAPGVPLFTVVNLRQVNVEASIPQEDLGKVKLGQSVEVRPYGMDKRFNGVVRFISPSSDPNSTTFPVKIAVSNPDGLLRGGMQADVFLAAGGQERTVSLPQDAVLKQGGAAYVFKVENGTVHRVRVTLMNAANERAVVKGELKPGDEIVLHPAPALADGAQVRVE